MLAPIGGHARQIGDAFEAAHEKNIIHRDLEPANIMIKAAGVVKVLAFGLAKAADESAESHAFCGISVVIFPGVHVLAGWPLAGVPVQRDWDQ
ncbi:MAG TPA: protein kinase [Bryobacteraceae bacterium]|nr:protein kinase [Bryobacteraceae bacterium]